MKMNKTSNVEKNNTKKLTWLKKQKIKKMLQTKKHQEII